MSAIMTWFLNTKVGRWLMAGLAGAGALATLAFEIFRAGRKNEQEKNESAALKGAQIRHEIDETVAGRTADDNRGRLRLWSRK